MHDLEDIKNSPYHFLLLLPEPVPYRKNEKSRLDGYEYLRYTSYNFSPHIPGDEEGIFLGIRGRWPYFPDPISPFYII